MFISIPSKFIEHFHFNDPNILNININSINTFMFRTESTPGVNKCNNGRGGTYEIPRDGRILVLNMNNNNHIIIQTYQFYPVEREVVDAYQQEFNILYSKLLKFFNNKIPYENKLS